jgi:hypothetical protein
MLHDEARSGEREKNAFNDCEGLRAKKCFLVKSSKKKAARRASTRV